MAAPTITGLRERSGTVAVELDGAAWRTFRVESAARAGLRIGLVLDRARLRELGRAHRRAEALATAARALRHRDLSAHALGERLERASIPAGARGEALRTLTEHGIVDDERLARSRTEHLVARGYSDAAIGADLARRGVAAGVALAALAGVAPELERARRVVEQRGTGPKTARLLQSRGFGEDAVESALGGDVADLPGGALG